MPLIFETKRLQVRQLQTDDVDNLYSVTSDPELTRYMDNGQPLSYELTAKWVEVSINNYVTKGYGCSAVIDKRDGAFIGFCGLVRSEFAEPPHDAELIYALKKPYWGQGLATEVAKAMVDYGCESCGLKRIIATIDPENSASIKVANKIGFVFSRTEPDSDGLPTHIYEIAGQ
ncbi:MAG: GNAT family N-acetyltransferase [Anaerolineaceae bacterium]|nr:GNAT family N-acetyltransferase [Anaerolineaceae bacterium]